MYVEGELDEELLNAASLENRKDEIFQGAYAADLFRSGTDPAEYPKAHIANARARTA